MTVNELIDRLKNVDVTLRAGDVYLFGDESHYCERITGLDLSYGVVTLRSTSKNEEEEYGE